MANTIQIGNSSSAVTQTINIGNNTAGTTNLVIGNTAAGTTTIQSAGGTLVKGNGVLTLGTGASGVNSSLVFGTSGAGSITLNTASTGSSYSLTLPTAQASGIQYLQNNGSGVLSWGATSCGCLLTVPGTTATNTIAPTAASVVGLTVKETAGTAADILDLQTSGGSNLLAISSTGVLTFGTDTNLYRASADTLKTDDAFTAAGGVYGQGARSYFNANLDAQSWATAVLIPININNFNETETSPNRSMRLLTWGSGGAYGGGISWGAAPQATNTWLAGVWSQGQYRLGYDGGTLTFASAANTPGGTPNAITWTDALTITGAGQIQLPVQGSGGGLVIGGDTNLYRSTADTLKTDDTLNVGTALQTGGTTRIDASGNLSNIGGISSNGNLQLGGAGTLDTDAIRVFESGKNLYLQYGSGGNTYFRNATGTIVATLNGGDLTLAGDAAVNGGDVTTTATTATVFNSTATTVSIGGAATTINLGPQGGAATINVGGGAGAVTFATATTGTVNLFNTNATTVNIGGAATTVTIGKDSTTLTQLKGSVGVNTAPDSTNQLFVNLASGKGVTIASGLLCINNGSVALFVCDAATSTSQVTLKLRAVTGQTGDIFAVEDSSAVNQFKINSSGDATFVGNIYKAGTAATVQGGPECGGADPGTCGSGGSISITGNNARGKVTITAGGSPSAGNLAYVNFGSTWATTPFCTITPFGGQPANDIPYIANLTTGTLTVKMVNIPTVGQSGSFYYTCIG